MNNISNEKMCGEEQKEAFVGFKRFEKNVLLMGSKGSKEWGEIPNDVRLS